MFSVILEVVDGDEKGREGKGKSSSRDNNISA